MFFKTKIVEVKVIDETEVKRLTKELSELQQLNKQQELDFASEKRIIANELKLATDKATESVTKENNELKEKNAVLNARVEILEKAFENMGFDVKDMKEILGKLVDGIVSKNTIQLVK